MKAVMSGPAAGGHQQDNRPVGLFVRAHDVFSQKKKNVPTPSSSKRVGRRRVWWGVHRSSSVRTGGGARSPLRWRTYRAVGLRETGGEQLTLLMVHWENYCC